MKKIKQLGLISIGVDGWRRTCGLYYCPACKKEVIKENRNGKNNTCSRKCSLTMRTKNPAKRAKKPKGPRFYAEPCVVEQFYLGRAL